MYAVLGIFLVVLTVAPARAQDNVHFIEVDQCDTMEFSVVNMPGDRYTWEIYHDDLTVNFAQTIGDVDPVVHFVDAMYDGSTVSVTGLDVGRYMIKVTVWDEEFCTNNIGLYVLDIIESIPEIELEGGSACIGEPTVVKVIFTGVGPYTIDYTYGDAITGNVVNMIGYIVDGPEAVISITDPLPVGPTTFWILKVEDDCRAYEFPIDERPSTGIIIYPKPTNSKIYLKDE